jgi:hypothetical protein
MDFAVLEAMLSPRCTCLNDIRTVLIAHDKRLLAVLGDGEIMGEYLPKEAVQLLQRHIVPSFIVGFGLHAGTVAEARAHRSDWLLKPSDGGKGIGIVFGRDCPSDEEWHALLDDNSPRSASPSSASSFSSSVPHRFILQRVVEQRIFPIRTASKTSLVAEPMLVVGLLHCINDRFYGPGIFRASNPTNPIVNLSGGKGVLLSPVLLSSKWTLQRKTN